MKTYLVTYRWRYTPLNEIENFDEKSKEPSFIPRLIYHALFATELIIKTNLNGEELYHFIKREIENKEHDSKTNKEYFIDNIIQL
jgi:hypothetical protein